jgi:hypothetical protein
MTTGMCGDPVLPEVWFVHGGEKVRLGEEARVVMSACVGMLQPPPWPWQIRSGHGLTRLELA